MQPGCFHSRYLEAGSPCSAHLRLGCPCLLEMIRALLGLMVNVVKHHHQNRGPSGFTRQPIGHTDCLFASKCNLSRLLLRLESFRSQTNLVRPACTRTPAFGRTLQHIEFPSHITNIFCSHCGKRGVTAVPWTEQQKQNAGPLAAPGPACSQHEFSRREPSTVSTRRCTLAPRQLRCTFLQAAGWHMVNSQHPHHPADSNCCTPLPICTPLQASSSSRQAADPGTQPTAAEEGW